MGNVLDKNKIVGLEKKDMTIILVRGVIIGIGTIMLSLVDVRDTIKLKILAF